MNTISIPRVVRHDTPSPKPTVIGDEVIINNGFFPDIQLSEIRNAMRIDGTVTNERLKHSALDAMQTVNRDLKDFRLKAQKKGKSRLSVCDEEQLNDESELDYLYKRAVFCLTTANLYERYRSFDSTREGDQKADQLIDTAGDLKRDYHFAVRDILGGNRMIAELV